MQTNLSTISHVRTDRPAPLLPGFYSMQTLSSDVSMPNITQYHRKAGSALQWKDKMAKERLFAALALCSS
jgi:hypothetical protein